ncbi:MAG: hypothetical protein MI757_16290 [Pirellulales bacterium]|nr:hypothetical protein [Pirellulales bacterium]
MRKAVLGICLLAASWVAVALAAGDSPSLPASPTDIRQAIARGDLIAFDAKVGETIQQLTVVDPKQKTISVYHIELETGKIQLRSVRNIKWDLNIEEYNAARPLPHEIRLQLQQR